MVELPVWSYLVAFSVSKKLAVLVAAKLYGIPRLYRKVLKANHVLLPRQSRWLWQRRIETAFRLPDRVLAMLKGGSAAAKPAAPAWAAVTPSAATRATAATAAAAGSTRISLAARQQAAATRLRLLASRFQRQVSAASERVRASPALQQAAPMAWTAHPFGGSFAALPVLPRAPLRSGGGVQLAWHHARALQQAMAAMGLEYLQRAALRQRDLRDWQRWRRSAVLSSA